MKLLVNARIYSFDHASRRWQRHGSLLIDGERIAALDEEPSGLGASLQRIDCDGATVLPAFADCHVHLTDTGFYTGPRDLSNATTYDQFAAAVERLEPEHGIILAGQYDETRWHDGGVADARPLDRAHGNARALVSRIDGHSCIVNQTTFAWLALDPSTNGIERDAGGRPTGRLFLDANWRAQSAFLAALPEAVRRAADRRAVDLALSRGALHLHAQLVGFPLEAYEREVQALHELPAKIHPKICEPDAALAQVIGLPYVGGDVFLDGSIGSRTAAMSHPYNDDRSTRGALRFTDDELLGYFAGAEALGIAAGVHAIGDEAIEQCIRVWERVLAGKPSPKGCRHFIEHFEVATRDHIEACARMGIYLSMQPQFDMLWGNPNGMYETRLGVERTHTMNPFAAIEAAGATLCGGDDSPVCALDPLAGMQAAIDHHQTGSRIARESALAMYTVNAARLAYAEHETGNLTPGLAADLVFLDRDPLHDDRAFTDCAVLQTWSNGKPLSP